MIFGLLGEKLAHSYSPMIHAELGDYEYKLFEKKPDELDSFFRQGNFNGLNVTIPYKKAVLKYCSSLSKAAKTIGSVNTIIKQDDGTLHGDNTDYYGFSYLLKQTKVDVTKGKILILGSGGSSLTVQSVLKDKEAGQITVVSRNGADNYDNIINHKDTILIINTTPVGMYPNNGVSPISDLSFFTNCEYIIDLIYNPSVTQLMFQAENCGIPSINGLSMLVAQAKGSTERFLQSNTPDDKIDKIIEKINRDTKNIILIGMPGCGKSSAGKELAKKLNREFADTDDLIVETAGKPIEKIINEDGERVFRKFETEALKTLCKRSSLVIATGGGVVTRAENRNIMKQNGKIVYLERDINELPTEGRPLSKKEGIEKLATQRIPLYENWCDLKVNATTITQTVDFLFDECKV